MFAIAATNMRMLQCGLCALGLLCLLTQADLQAQEENIWITRLCSTTISIAWKAAPGNDLYYVSHRDHVSNPEVFVGTTPGTSIAIRELQPDTEYEIFVDADSGVSYQTTAITDGSNCWQIKKRAVKKAEREPEWKPIPRTCRELPPHVIVTGDVIGTQCQTVGDIVIARTSLIERGFIGAVDIWGEVPESVEVCLAGDGWLALMDTDYAPRMAMELEHSHRAGMTCATIDRPGTVVLLESAPPPAAEREPATLPTFDPVPLSDCLIKLVETLFLRAEPAGEIIGLVWLNSEVPAFEINGYWYKVEFEGVTGYISRYHRKVLRGGCG